MSYCAAVTFTFDGTRESFDKFYDAIALIDLDIGAYWKGRAAVAALLCPGLLSCCPFGVTDRSCCVGYDVAHKNLAEERGLIFIITAIKWVDDSTVEVAGGYYQNGLSASGNTYTVKKEDGKWRVTKDKLHWIS